jgi:hypothetical protein
MLITMMMVAMFAVVAMLAMSVGYHCGRRVGAAPPTWKQRTSRIALGRRAVDLVVLIAARRVRRRFRHEPVFEPFGLRIVAPLDLLRGSVTRVRAYRGAPGW